MSVASKFFQPCFCLASILMVAACGSGSSNTNNSVYSVPQGNFVVSQQLSPDDTSFYTVGCTTLGQSTDAFQVDSRLTPGMVFDTAYNIFSGGTTVTLSVQNIINTVSANSLVEALTVLSVTGDPSLQPGFTTIATYNLDPTDGSFPVTYNPQPPSDPLPTSNCTINLSSTPSSVTKFLGTFTTLGGTPVSAQEDIVNATGDITCAGQDLGTGTISYTAIVSNSVPSEGTDSFCGGVAVYAGLTETEDNGTLLVGLSAERTLIPSAALTSLSDAGFSQPSKALRLQPGLRQDPRSTNPILKTLRTTFKTLTSKNRDGSL